MHPIEPDHAYYPQPNAEDSTSAAGLGEFAQMALWWAGTLAGMVTSVLLSRGPLFRARARKVGVSIPHGGKPAPRPSQTEALPLLVEAIVGNRKRTIEAVFGPPRGAILASPSGLATTFWNADTWYYDLPRGQHIALMIEFSDDLARRVHFLKTPAAA